MKAKQVGAIMGVAVGLSGCAFNPHDMMNVMKYGVVPSSGTFSPGDSVPEGDADKVSSEEYNPEDDVIVDVYGPAPEFEDNSEFDLEDDMMVTKYGPFIDFGDSTEEIEKFSPDEDEITLKYGPFIDNN